MKQGYLSQYFQGVAIKRLSAVETDPASSHQHEFNGAKELRTLLGEPDGSVTYAAQFLYLQDGEEDSIADEGFLTWYDARQKARIERGVMRWEYRLYFRSNIVMDAASEGDLLVIAKLDDDSLMVIVAAGQTTSDRQLLWLFGCPSMEPRGFAVRTAFETDVDQVRFAARVILEQIGIEPKDLAEEWLEQMLRRFGAGFPATAVFSAFARETLPGVHSREDPDAALLVWMEREEALFRTFEKHLMVEKLQQLAEDGFGDPDPVIRIVQSALQRRRSRAGSALENHLEQVFGDFGITHARNPVTEKGHRPDFIFPGIADYLNPCFPSIRLTMLGVKTTCRDRWRQILNEAGRIPAKHLLTLEPGISENQTAEMRSEQVQLVLPSGLHNTYTANQKNWLMSVAGFIKMAVSRQRIP